MKATQIIHFSDDKYVLTDAGRSLLRGIGDEPFGVVVVAGAYRTGKSFLSNFLVHGTNDGAQETEVFTTGSTNAIGPPRARPATPSAGPPAGSWPRRA